MGGSGPAWLTTPTQNSPMWESREWICGQTCWSSSTLFRSKQLEASELWATKAETNRNSWRRRFLPPLNVGTSTHAAFSLLTRTFFFQLSSPHRQTHRKTRVRISALLLLTRQPTPLASLGHQSAFPLWGWCDRGAVRASQSDAVRLSQSDRETGGNTANKHPVILPCPFTSSSLSNQSADRVGKNILHTGTHPINMYRHIFAWMHACIQDAQVHFDTLSVFSLISWIWRHKWKLYPSVCVWLCCHKPPQPPELFTQVWSED